MFRTLRWSILGFFCLAAIAVTRLPVSAADKPTRPSPSLVTLHAERKPLADVLKSLARQSGNRLDERGVPDATVSLDLQGVPFWKALDAVAAAGDCRVELYNRSGLLRLIKRGLSRRLPVSHDGFFRLTVKKITAVRDLETDASRYTAQLEVVWEPRLEPLLLETHPRDLIVKDDRGQVLANVPDGSLQAPVDGKLAVAFDVPLPALPRSAAKIGLFQGKLTAIAPTEMLTLTFGTIAHLVAKADRRHTEKGMTCALTKVRVQSDAVVVQVQIELPAGGPALESYQSWVVSNEIWLQAKGKEKRLQAGYTVESWSARHALLTYHFTDKDVLARPGDWTLVYRTPAGFVELPIEFSFKDLPLP